MPAATHGAQGGHPHRNVSSSAPTRDNDALLLATTTSSMYAWALHRQFAQPCAARLQSIGKSLQPHRLHGPCTHRPARTRPCAHAYVRSVATGLTRHDAHAYMHGMSRGLQPRPFCRVDRQLAGASPLCRQARPITGGCRSHAENSIRSTMILKAYAPESAP